MIKLKDKKKKGFTLVEVLGAIAILSILTLSTIFIVSKIVDNSKQKQAQISLTNIKETGRTYIEEFKTNSKYWSGIKEESGEIKVERACTTIGQLIDTGYLKEEIALKDALLFSDFETLSEKYKKREL